MKFRWYKVQRRDGVRFVRALSAKDALIRLWGWLDPSGSVECDRQDVNGRPRHVWNDDGQLMRATGVVSCERVHAFDVPADVRARGYANEI